MQIYVNIEWFSFWKCTVRDANIWPLGMGSCEKLCEAMFHSICSEQTYTNSLPVMVKKNSTSFTIEDLRPTRLLRPFELKELPRLPSLLLRNTTDIGMAAGEFRSISMAIRIRILFQARRKTSSKLMKQVIVRGITPKGSWLLIQDGKVLVHTCTKVCADGIHMHIVDLVQYVSHILICIVSVLHKMTYTCTYKYF